MAIPIGLGDIRAASDFLGTQVNRTPVVTSQTLNEIVGADVRLKCENFQRVGAFKIRGALNRIGRLSETEKSRGVITHSSGNHAQAVSLAAKILGVKAHIVMPKTAPAVKREATLGYGAEITPCEPSEEERERVTAELIERCGYVFVPPFDDWEIIAGQGTAALELWEDDGPFDVLLAPVGGGGLLAGTAITGKGFSPRTKIFGVEPAGADDAKRGFDLGMRLRQREPNTIADGLLTSVGERPFRVMQELVDDILVVDDREILFAMRFCFERLKLVVEPSGAVPLAALLCKKLPYEGQRIGAIISGGNLDLSALFEMFEGRSIREGSAPPP